MNDSTGSTICFRQIGLANLGFVAILLVSGQASAAVAPSLGTAQSFAVLGATPNVNNTGPTVVTGDLGVSPAAAVVGFPPGAVIGTIHAADATAAGAQSANTTAYGVLAGEACDTSFGVPTDLAGMTLAPGVYCFASSAANTGLLQLDAMGNSNAVWVFQIATTLITASASTVAVINGGQACNVFWQVGSSATLGTTTAFVGNILALTSVTLQTGASLSGRALAQTGTVTLATNDVTVCSAAGGGPAPTTLTTHASAAVQLGGLIHDTAALSGGVAPTGTITFSSFGPNNASCAGAPAFTSTVTVAGNGAYVSANFTPSLPGAYRWIAAYSGDANNVASATACNDANESVTVSTASASTAGIPTLSEWAMVLLAGLVAFAGFAAMRRRRGVS